MHRLFRRNKQPPPVRRRGPARWTAWEAGLIVISLLLIVFPLYAEAYRWINPAVVPAAQRETEVVATGEPGEAVPDQPADTSVAEPPTETPTPPPPEILRVTPTIPGVPADTPTNTVDPNQPTNTPTDTPGVPTDTPTETPITPGVPTDTPTETPTTPGVPTDTPTETPGTPGVPTDTPTETPITPGVPTDTPSPTMIITDPPLAVVKVASVSTAGRGQEFSYSISVFSTSDTPNTIDVNDPIDPAFQAINASASNGTCTVGASVSCTVTAQRDRPVTITINVRVTTTAQVGANVPNQAVASDQQGLSASSDTVVVEISGATVPPTNTPVPGVPTNTPVPGVPTNTPVPGVPTNTPVPGVPTNTPVVGQPTSPPPPPRRPPGGPEDTPEPAPTTPPQPPLPPTPRPGQPAPTARPAPRRTATPGPARTATGTTTTAATATPTGVAGLPTPEPGLFFRMASDWGSAFPGQEVNYVIAVKNTRPSGAMQNMQIGSAMPENLEILDLKADRGDPKRVGNQISLKLDALQPGETVEIAIKTKIKDSVEIGTRIVSQADLTYNGLTLPAHSNIVTLLVVGAAQVQAPVQLQATEVRPTVPATSTTAPTATPTNTTAAATATPPPTATNIPTSNPDDMGENQLTPNSPNGPAAGMAPLPNTSSGVPIFGFVLLGMTLMVRTIRIHRMQTRI